MNKTPKLDTYRTAKRNQTIYLDTYEKRISTTAPDIMRKEVVARIYPYSCPNLPLYFLIVITNKEDSFFNNYGI